MNNDVWKADSFPSGTTIVTRQCTGLECSWYYIFGPKNSSDEDRWQICVDLKDYLNGGKRPIWLNEMNRISEFAMEHKNGSRIVATGPVYDANPPTLQWKELETPEAKYERAKLIDRIHLVRI